MRNFEEEIKTLHPNIQVLEIIKNGNQKIKCKCSKDGYEWTTRSYDLLRGHGCHACAGRPRYNTETFKEAIGKINKDVVILSEYKGAHKNIEWRCNKCGNKKVSKAYHLTAGSSCRECSYVENGIKSRKTLQKYRQEVFNLVGNEYQVLGGYKNTNTDVKFKHESCGFEFESIAKNFLNGSRCPKCNGGFKKKDTNYFKAEVKEISGGEYDFLGTYSSQKVKGRFLHKACGSVFFTTPDSFLGQKTRCPECFFLSKGEIEIKKILLDKGVSFSQQKTFEGLEDAGKLRFDFYLPEQNLCIEYDGKQHFMPIEPWGGEVEFEKIKIRDSIKNKYCQDNGINLLRIHYKEKDVRGIVEGILNVRQHPGGIERTKNMVLL